MPRFSEHCEKSKELFGEDGRLFHHWIDRYSSEGYRHRQILHNKEGVEIGVQLWGEKARRHLEQHIKDDYDTDKIPTIKELRRYPRNTDGLKKKKFVGMLNVEPKWVDLYPEFCSWIDEGKNLDILKGELLRLCKFADNIKETLHKKGEE